MLFCAAPPPPPPPDEHRISNSGGGIQWLNEKLQGVRVDLVEAEEELRRLEECTKFTDSDTTKTDLMAQMQRVRHRAQRLRFAEEGLEMKLHVEVRDKVSSLRKDKNTPEGQLKEFAQNLGGSSSGRGSGRW